MLIDPPQYTLRLYDIDIVALLLAPYQKVGPGVREFSHVGALPATVCGITNIRSVQYGS